jgi:DNA-binding protein YbaB
MSEERFDRLESQLAQIIQNMATKQDLAAVEQNMATKQDLAAQQITALQNNVNALREDIASLRYRIDSVEGAVSVVIRNTFTAHQNFVDDLNFDLLRNERATRRLSRRVTRLEREDLDD